jgi:hypothetical protein
MEILTEDSELFLLKMPYQTGTLAGTLSPTDWTKASCNWHVVAICDALAGFGPVRLLQKKLSDQVPPGALLLP